MRKTTVILLSLIIIILSFGQVFAEPGDVWLLPLSKWNYKNVDGYGFYDKCGSTSGFVMVLNNPTSEDFIIQLPSEARISGWNGTVHKLTNFRYKIMDFGSNNFQRTDRKEIPFSGDLTLPAQSTYAIYLTVMSVEAYNLYWDTDVFFTVRIKGSGKTADLNVSGILAQHGNACPADQVCSASVENANYISDGSGSVIVHIKNDMPDTTEVSALTNVDIEWTDSDGKTQSRSVQNGVNWNSHPGWMGSGTEKTVSGVLSLPIDITAAQHELTLTFHFHHPSSYWFGDFSASTRLTVSGGLQGAMTGSFEADGSGGSFTAVLNNYQSNEVQVTLPEIGTLSAQDGKTSKIALDWGHSGPLLISAYGRSELSGRFTFTDTELIHNNSSLIISAELTSGAGNGHTAGTVIRNPDPDPKLLSVGFCRDYTPGEDKLQIVYALRSDAFIDIPVQLAGTLAVDSQPKNLQIRYTACESGGKSCFSRISGSNFIIEPGETAVFYGEVTLEKILETAGASVRTSLLYTPDGVTKALYVGQTSASCSATGEEPVSTATSVPTELPTSVPTDIPTEVPTEMPTPVPTEIPVNTPTAVPTSVPTEIPTPVMVPEPPLLEVTVSGGYYSSCSSDIALRFTMTIRNNGLGAGDLSLKEIDFKMDGKKIPVVFASCMMMTAGGTGSCPDGFASGRVTINPETSMRIEAVYSPSNPIQADSVQISLKSKELIPENLEFTAYSIGSECEPLVEIEALPNDWEGDFSGTVSSGGDHIDLILHLVNSGTADAEITPGTIYLHNASIEDYQGIGMIRPAVFYDVIKDSFLFSRGEPFTLPAQSAADLELVLRDIPAMFSAGRTEITWNFSIGNEIRNFTGSADLTQRPGSERTEPENPKEDENRAEPAASQTVLQGPLPATGFPLKPNVNRLPLRTHNSEYKSLDDLWIEIPTLETSAEIVSVSLGDNGEWDVEQLGERAGILCDTPLPGKGTSVIAAHNHLDEMTAGPFFALNQIKPGDRIFVSDREGQMRIFSVYGNTLVTPDDSGALYRGTIPGSLILLTCESELPEGGYAYRRLVFAEPLQ